MNRISTSWGRQKPQSRANLSVEALESRHLMTTVPFGATADDTGEFMLGDVLVSVVLMESDGSIDADVEKWTPQLVSSVQQNVQQGLQWWSDALAQHTSVHSLKFEIDYTYALNPIRTGYEPIQRPSDDFVLWIEDFFDEVNVDSSQGFSHAIRQFNHAQRVKFGTDWSFTIFVVNADLDPNDRFDATGSFGRAFAYAGGRFFVMPHSRPASSIAHETGHMFWAHDEYSGGEDYNAVRGYYGTKNTNAYTGNPSPLQREVSIMDSPSAAYASHAISKSAREMIGWKDSDGDGIFDVLDVPHKLSGQGTFDAANRIYRFQGLSTVATLPNRNTDGTRHSMTTNRITGLQYQLNGSGPWIDLANYDAYSTSLDVHTPRLGNHVTSIQFRTIDHRLGVTSSTFAATIPAGSTGTNPLQNPLDPHDVDGDGFVSARDVLLIVIRINRGGNSEPGSGPPYVDTTGDGVISARDALIVINRINRDSRTNNTLVAAPPRIGSGVLSASPPDSISFETDNSLATRHLNSDVTAALFSEATENGTNRRPFWN